MLTFVAMGLGFAILPSCRDNPELTARRERQTRKLVELERRLAEMHAEMSVRMPETAKHVAESRKKLEEAEVLVNEKETELFALETDLGTAIKAHQTYRARYVVEKFSPGAKP